MRLQTLSLVPLLLLTPAGADNTNTDTSPFYQPQLNSNNHNANLIFDSRSAKEAIALAKRQGGGVCPAGFNSCALLGAPEACCQPKAVCSRDDANNIACCPSGAACTGRLSGPSQTASSSGFMFPQPGTATTTPPTDPTSTRPIVPNAPYPFPIIPTTFPNQEACVSAYTDCQVQYSSCTASLGGVHGVTIGGAGGITVPGVQPTGGNPVSVCSSLSTEACHGLQAAYCTAFRGVAARGGGGLLYDIVVGVAVAVAGVVV
ncbi:hypothetical protein GX51_07285 [Blastomyces parvus]|uniref:Hydrophobin n=1 Tax=Blastomyces parvus TaxID=2060905 RepID=A0A2B7WDM1_9EURO|nr:hypothetical protein GX51_07285 [Blastomyces parvus]